MLLIWHIRLSFSTQNHEVFYICCCNSESFNISLVAIINVLNLSTALLDMQIRTQTMASITITMCYIVIQNHREEHRIGIVVIAYRGP